MAANWKRLTIGSNVVENTSGIIVVEGKRLMYLERGMRGDQLLLTADIYDERGSHIAKLRRNAWVFNEEERFEITTHPVSLKLIERGTDRIVIEANIYDRDRIEVPRGKIYTPSGDLIEIAPDFMRLLGTTMSGNVLVGVGSFLVIEPGSLGIGSGTPPPEA